MFGESLFQYFGYYVRGVVVQGLEVLESVRSNQPLIEYKGKVMLREQYDKENIFFKRYVFRELSLKSFISALVQAEYSHHFKLLF